MGFNEENNQSDKDESTTKPSGGIAGIPAPKGDPTQAPPAPVETSGTQTTPAEVKEDNSIPVPKKMDTLETESMLEEKVEEPVKETVLEKSTTDNSAELENLKKKLEEKQSELESTNSKVSDLETKLKENSSKISELETKLREAEATKPAEDLSNKVESLQNEVNSLKQAKEETEKLAKDRETEGHQKDQEILKLKTELESKSSGGDATSLKEEVKILKTLLSTGSSALDMYEVLKNHRALNLRKLSMQSGMAAAACKKLLEGLEKAGIVKIESSGPDDMDPKVTLISN